MKKEEVLKTLNEILVNIFEDDSIVLDDTTTTNNINGWDSITKIMFIGEVEEKFNIKIATKDVLSLNSFSAFADTISGNIK